MTKEDRIALYQQRASEQRCIFTGVHHGEPIARTKGCRVCAHCGVIETYGRGTVTNWRTIRMQSGGRSVLASECPECVVGWDVYHGGESAEFKYAEMFS